MPSIKIVTQLKLKKVFIDFHVYLGTSRKNPSDSIKKVFQLKSNTFESTAIDTIMTNCQPIKMLESPTQLAKRVKSAKEAVGFRSLFSVTLCASSRVRQACRNLPLAKSFLFFLFFRFKLKTANSESSSVLFS